MALIAHLTYKHYKWYLLQVTPTKTHCHQWTTNPFSSSSHPFCAINTSEQAVAMTRMIHLKTTGAQLIIVSLSRSQIIRFGSIRVLSRCESRVKRLVAPEAANPHGSQTERSGLYPLLLFILLIQQPSAPQTPPQEITSDLGRANVCVCVRRVWQTARLRFLLGFIAA